MIGALYKNSKSHWNTAVHGLTFNVLKLLMEADPAFFDECSAKHRTESEKEEEIDEARQAKWDMLQAYFDNNNERVMKEASLA